MSATRSCWAARMHDTALVAVLTSVRTACTDAFIEGPLSSGFLALADPGLASLESLWLVRAFGPDVEVFARRRSFEDTSDAWLVRVIGVDGSQSSVPAISLSDGEVQHISIAKEWATKRAGCEGAATLTVRVHPADGGALVRWVTLNRAGRRGVEEGGS